MSLKSRSVFGTQARIYDGAFLWIYLTVYYFLNKNSNIDVRQVSENVEIFKVKLRWSKSLQLLQRVAFLVKICQIMTAITNAENLEQYKSRVYLNV